MSFLPVDINYVTAEMIQNDVDKLEESSKVKEKKLADLRQKIKGIPNLFCLEDDNFLMVFLRFAKFDIKKAAECMENFYLVKAKNEEIFGNLDFEIINRMYEENIINVLPFRDADGSVIVLISFDRFDFDKVKFSSFLMILAVTAICLVDSSTANQFCGLKIITEVKGIGVRHLKYISPKYIILIANSVSGLLPVHYKALHFLNPSPALQFLRNLANFVMSEKMRKRVLFHKGEDLPKYFDPTILPKAHGGTLNCDNEFLLKKIPEFNSRIFELFLNNQKRKDS